MSLNRRDFVRTSALAAAAAWTPRSFWASIVPSNLTEIRRGVGFFEGDGGTIGWMIDRHATVVVDTQSPASAETLWADVQDRAARPIDLLINSHHHNDHTGGNPVLAPHAGRHLAHRNVPALQRAAAERNGDIESQVYPTLLYDREWKEDVGDEAVSLRYYGAAHTGGDSVIHFEKANVVHMGDLVFDRMPGYIDLPGGATSEGWIGVLEAVHSDFGDETIFIFGHHGPAGSATGSKADLLVMRDFLTALREYVRKGIASGQSAEGLHATRLPGWDDHFSPDWPDGLNIGIDAVYEELSAG